MSIFGNGVITDWVVSSTGNFTLSISEGHGNINWLSCRSNFPYVIENVSPNSIRYVYAKSVRNSSYDESVEFILSQVDNLTDPNFLLLARVVSGPNDVQSIDNTVRDQIEFIDIIRNAIQQHKHRGGSANPSKIDLSSEVKGQLPSFRIADFDADKITTGTIDLARLPLIDHSELQNIGLLTHPQLDTFIKTLETSNKELFGEIGTSNLLQLIIALKFIYDDPDSSSYLNNGLVDENMINEFALIPGVTPNSHIDFENSTADINLQDHYIQGIAGTVGTSFYVRWENQLAWESAYSMENLAIVNDTVTLAYNPADEQNIQVLESFNEDPTGGFTQEILTFKDGQFISGADNDAPDGGQVGVFDPAAEFKLIFVKKFDELQDWSQFETFLWNVKTINAQHGPVRYFFVDEIGANNIVGLFNQTVDSSHKTPDFILLESNHQTYNPNPLMNDYEINSVNIDTLLFRDQIKGIVIWTDYLTGGFTFRLDDMRLSRSVLLPSSGVLKLRYSTSSSITFSKIEFTAVEPEGTDIVIRARSANGTVLLNRASYTRSLSSGSEISLEGTDLEIELNFSPNANRSITPILYSVRLLIITDAEIDGFSINTQQEFIRGEANNINIENSVVGIETPISVGSYCLANGNKILQIHKDISTAVVHTDSEITILGMNAPIAPNQIFRAIEYEEESVTESDMYYPRSVRRLYDKSFVVADTYNDRVLHFDENGNLIEGFGSINYQANTLFPLSACIDRRTGILYIVWSKSIAFTSVNVSRMQIKYGALRIELLSGYDLINNKLSTTLSGSDRGQVLTIYLSDANKSLITQLPDTGSILMISSNTVQELINEQSVFYQKAMTMGGGLPLYLGNFWYTDVNSLSNVPVFCPTYAEKTENETYIITNAKVAIKNFSFPTGVTETITRNPEISSFPSILEIDSSKSAQKTIFTSGFVDFSPFVPGRASRIDDHTILSAGLITTGEEKEVEGFNFRTIIGTDEEKNAQKTKLNEIFFGSAKPYSGAVRTISTYTDGGAEVFKYNTSSGLVVSDADFDSVGNIVAAESTFVGRSGRIIKIDSGGNIIFSYGEGMYSVINDIKVKEDDSIIISS